MTGDIANEKPRLMFWLALYHVIKKTTWRKDYVLRKGV